ncbi:MULTISPECIES: siderophore-interacting protein [unclassified Streptomyces]|uniref:siderophore-interacting protein n=1 Tax=unclassified Streptomyces TaxID=2593676 RepID=UPI002ED14359|nr:siderophore-interacting protein [Streptomyces sp. NBC_00891]WSY06075.1 siderophore-interacting protein [Streptomyces sp. NBC_00890]WSZ07699.1 siderophore-interacting protein [Streptomyces sp. NBC_00869]WSZ24802.1 siderophore-interacting protein [Streptomyces sp. NBC_00870]
MGHGREGVVLKLMRGRDFTFTVTATEPPADGFRRVAVTDGGLLAATGGAHPTMWVRLWFDRSGKPHQRAYTLVDPDPEAGTFTLEFALHEGPATDWALAAKPGDTIDATLQGTGFSLPDPTPSRLVVIGDPASLPAMNSLLDALPDTPATLWYETAPGASGEPPLRLDPARHTLHRVERHGRGAALVDAVKSGLPEVLSEDASGAYVWIACDTATTRSLSSYVRKDLAVPRERVHALGYWRAG